MAEKNSTSPPKKKNKNKNKQKKNTHTSVSEPLRSRPLSYQKRPNTITMFIVNSVAGMATDLTINYAKFTPLNVWNFAPLHVFIMLR